MLAKSLGAGMAGKDKKIAEYHRRHGPKRISKKVGKKGDNLAPDVRAIQCLLNLPLSLQAVGKAGSPKLPLSGKVDAPTQEAIDLYQSKVLGITDGIIYPGDATVVSLWGNLPGVPATKYEHPAWLRAAQGEEDNGISEFGEKISAPTTRVSWSTCQPRPAWRSTPQPDPCFGEESSSTTISVGSSVRRRSRSRLKTRHGARAS